MLIEATQPVKLAPHSAAPTFVNVRCSWGTRLLSTLVAFASAVVITEEAAGLHRCPVHDSAAVASDAAHPDSHAGHDNVSQSSSEQGKGTDHGCHCLGPGCSTCPVTVPLAHFQLAQVELSVESPELPRAVSRRVVPPAHALPFSIGPPASI